MSSPLLQLTLARLRLFFREPGAIFWTFGFPLVLAVALGVAFRNRPPEPARVGVAALVQTNPLVRSLDGAPGLQVIHFDSEAEGRRALRTGNVDVVVLEVEPAGSTELLHDPTRPESRLALLLVSDRLQRKAGRRDVVALAERPVTEPGSRYIDFLIPGLIGMTLMSSGMWGIGYVVVEMRTRKLLKRLAATPMSRAQFLFSFVIMRLSFLFLELPVLVGFGWIFFSVRVTGSIALLLGVAILGGLAFSGLGLLVASRAQNTQTASGLINLVMMPMWIGSGIFFSTARFPAPVQPFLKALPLTALNDALRGVMIDGSGARALWAPITLLAATAVLSFAAALRFFRWR